jgi:hypothetical protein
MTAVAKPGAARDAATARGAAAAPSAYDLAALLQPHPWLRREHPFPHVVARDVFVPAFHAALVEAFEDVLANGFGDARGAGVWSGVRNYDASGLQFPPTLAGPLGLFVSRAWHDLFARLMGVDATGHINSGLHHHATGSADGTIHSDLNPGWFAEYASPDGIRVSLDDRCRYTTGETAHEHVHAVETVRAVAILVYLANPPWHPGDGGETALFATRGGEPAALVPPVDNTLLAFECTPHSFHAFRSNHRNPRNSMIMWLHRPKADVVARWGEAAIVPWGGRR